MYQSINDSSLALQLIEKENGDQTMCSWVRERCRKCDVIIRENITAACQGAHHPIGDANSVLSVILGFCALHSLPTPDTSSD
ncbi:hypothetical protein BFJ63_vAg17761 [Fusarium oxysporum f. sp. narcissi]|uniref:Uncharacterized protein n=2 Tax=Fusarium oxysporum TaxID=5507 RepID=A0A8H6LBN2_FUSOX|nr:hypothetical protein HZS61_006430 [Fusarium oxysporum f. sp. conglutinans]KAK2480340.1 hypothetical protein H9L39_07908 [Fusarium oxysporum f. sp. albedinis]RKK26582.1 hypothetical protein BFJ66_g17056 [Fusarium oxysporum f. sp. cepae]RYC79354.1 hypothetical protein BFJ63_vAg17761 [Fusarium oxysporum f. sp. narcissi]